MQSWYRIASYTWELEPQRIGWLTGLWATGQIITGIYIVNDEVNGNVSHSGMLVALTMNTNETESLWKKMGWELRERIAAA